MTDPKGEFVASPTPEEPDRLHAAIMNLPCKFKPEGDDPWATGYSVGHSAARHAAAELVSAALPAAQAERPDAEAWDFTRWRRELVYLIENHYDASTAAKHRAMEAITRHVDAAGMHWRAVTALRDMNARATASGANSFPTLAQMKEKMAEIRPNWPNECFSVGGADLAYEALKALAAVAQEGAQAAKLGAHVEKFATTLGWTREDGEGALEYIQRKSYRQGWEDGRQEGAGNVHRDSTAPAPPQEWNGKCVLGHCGSPSGCEGDGHCRADPASGVAGAQAESKAGEDEHG